MFTTFKCLPSQLKLLVTEHEHRKCPWGNTVHTDIFLGSQYASSLHEVLQHTDSIIHSMQYTCMSWYSGHDQLSVVHYIARSWCTRPAQTSSDIIIHHVLYTYKSYPLLVHIPTDWIVSSWVEWLKHKTSQSHYKTEALYYVDDCVLHMSTMFVFRQPLSTC